MTQNVNVKNWETTARQFFGRTRSIYVYIYIYIYIYNSPCDALFFVFKIFTLM